MSRVPLTQAQLAAADRLLAQVREPVARALADLAASTQPNINEIEAASAAVGDLLARTVVLADLKRQTPTTDAELAAARQEALNRAAPEAAAQRRPEELQMVRQAGRSCELHTMRGPIPYSRDYLHFPDLGVGVFPPRPPARYP